MAEFPVNALCKNSAAPSTKKTAKRRFEDFRGESREKLMTVKKKSKGMHGTALPRCYNMTGSSIIDGVRIFSQEDLRNAGLTAKIGLKYNEEIEDNYDHDNSSKAEDDEFVENFDYLSQSPTHKDDLVSNLPFTKSSDSSWTDESKSSPKQTRFKDEEMKLQSLHPVVDYADKSRATSNISGRIQEGDTIAESTACTRSSEIDFSQCNASRKSDTNWVALSSKFTEIGESDGECSNNAVSTSQFKNSFPSIYTTPPTNYNKSTYVFPWRCAIPSQMNFYPPPGITWPPVIRHQSTIEQHRNISSNYSGTPTKFSDYNLMPQRNYVKALSTRSRYIRLPHYDLSDLNSLSLETTFIDTHCHLDFLFKRAEFKGTYSKYRYMNAESFPSCYEGCVTVFCDPTTFGKFTMWRDILNEDNVWGTFGCHPHMAHLYNDSSEEYLKIALTNNNVVALGEIGLDYSAKNSTDHIIQKKIFRRQLKIALEKQLPIVIHSRDSDDDTITILKEEIPLDYKIHRHCFTGTWNEARQWLSVFPNLYLGLTALVTFPTATTIHGVAQNIPLNRLLLETDTPYFVPRKMTKEKKFSHPGMAIHVAAQIVALRSDTNLKELLHITRQNTRNMYGI